MHASERDGTNIIYLTCPVCGWSGDVWYTTRQPTYCSDACRQKAYRMRKRNADQSDDVTKRSRRFRLYNRIRTDTIENRIAMATAMQMPEHAWAWREVAAAVDAPIREDVITSLTERYRRVQTRPDFP